MDSITKLPSCERLLADFIYHGHMEKRQIIQHTIYEAQQLLLVKQFDSAKHSQMEQVLKSEPFYLIAGFRFCIVFTLFKLCFMC